VGTQVNIRKMKVMVFSKKRKHNQHKFHLGGNILEEVVDYKYLIIEIKELWGIGKHFMLFKIGLETKSYGT